MIFLRHSQHLCCNPWLISYVLFIHTLAQTIHAEACVCKITDREDYTCIDDLGQIVLKYFGPDYRVQDWAMFWEHQFLVALYDISWDSLQYYNLCTWSTTDDYYVDGKTLKWFFFTQDTGLALLFHAELDPGTPNASVNANASKTYCLASTKHNRLLLAL